MIDIHAHYFPDDYLDLLQRFGSTTTDGARNRGAGGSQVELQMRLGTMDSVNVQMQVLSASDQQPYLEKRTEAVEAAQMSNDLSADLVQRYPDRFAAFASLPLPHVEASLAEMGRALDSLGMVGVTIAPSILGRSLVDPVFEPLYAELDRRHAVLFIHPEGMNAYSPLIADYGLTWPIGAPIEDTVAVTHLMIKGIPMRYPHINIIISHLGGTLPMLLGCLDDLYFLTTPDVPDLPSVQARCMWYDTVAHGSVPALLCACSTLGADRLVLGSDFPYQSGESYRRAITDITNAGLAEPDVRRILDTNTQALFELGEK